MLITKELFFKQTFGVSPRKFMDSVLGFDIIRFDEEVIKPVDGVSTADTIEAKHGKRAVELMEQIISAGRNIGWLFERIDPGASVAASIIPEAPAVSNAPSFNYYMAHRKAVTWHKAYRMGLRPTRKYGYYVIMTPAEPGVKRSHNNVSIVSWCRTKAIALKSVSDDDFAKRQGYHSCPKGCDKQARGCPHGIPEMVLSMPLLG